MAEEWRTEGSARRSQHPIASCYGARTGAADKRGRPLFGAGPRADRGIHREVPVGCSFDAAPAGLGSRNARAPGRAVRPALVLTVEGASGDDRGRDLAAPRTAVVVVRPGALHGEGAGREGHVLRAADAAG